MVKRTAILLLGLTLAGSLIGGWRFVAATAPGQGDHPAVGSWNVEADPGDAEFSPRLVILSSDGTALYVSGEKLTGVGSWEATGDSTAAATFATVSNGPALIVLRASIEVAPDGQSFTGTFTDEFIFDPAGGGTSGQIGPGTLAGTRIIAEAPSTPVMSFEEMFPQPDASPVASPSS